MSKTSKSPKSPATKTAKPVKTSQSPVQLPARIYRGPFAEAVEGKRCFVRWITPGYINNDYYDILAVDTLVGMLHCRFAPAYPGVTVPNCFWMPLTQINTLEVFEDTPAATSVPLDLSD
jgi:hypothetical protein